jgi:serine phosphatase RsbU (regulator of sigma subunit)
MAQFFALGLQLPADHPDRRKYFSLALRKRPFTSSDVAEITLNNPGDMLVLYTDGVYDGSDEQAREQLESILREHQHESAREICAALMDYAIGQDELLRQNGDEALIDDKTVFLVKRTE